MIRVHALDRLERTLYAELGGKVVNNLPNPSVSVALHGGNCFYSPS